MIYHWMRNINGNISSNNNNNSIQNISPNNNIKSPIGGGVIYCPPTENNEAIFTINNLEDTINSGIQISFWINCLGSHFTSSDANFYCTILSRSYHLYFYIYDGYISSLRIFYNSNDYIDYPISYDFGTWIFVYFTFKNHISNVYLNGNKIVDNLYSEYNDYVDKNIIGISSYYASLYGYLDDIYIRDIDKNFNPNIVPNYYLSGRYKYFNNDDQLYGIKKEIPTQ